MAVTARYLEQPVSVLLEPGQRALVEQIAERDGVSIAAVVRFVLANNVSLKDIATSDMQVPNRG